MAGSTYIIRQGSDQVILGGDPSNASLLLGAGSTGTPQTTATADKNHIGLWTENSATSGDNRGIYNRFYLSGAGGGGESLRSFTTVNDVAAGTAHGAHLSLNFASTGTVTGLGVAARATLHIANQGTQAGTMAAVMAEIWSDGATSDPAGSLLSCIRVVNDGNSTGKADVDDDAAALDFVGWTDATGNMIYGHTVRARVAGTSKYLLFSDDENRLDLSTINVDAANTDGGIIKIGTSASPVTEDTADMKFISLYFDNGATSGDNRGIYNRLYLTGAAGGGESLRTFTTVSNVAGGTAHGAHISLDFASTGTVTGLGVAMRATLHIANQATQAGTMSPIQAEIWSDGATSDPAGSQLSYIRVVNGGNATGAADVDDDAYFISLQGATAGAAKMFATGLTAATVNAATTASLKCLVGGTVYYIPLATAIG